MDEVFSDCIQDDSKFNAGELLETAYPGDGRSNRTFTPVFRYLHSVGLTSKEELEASKYEGAKKVVRKLSNANFALANYAGRFEKQFAGLTTNEIIASASSPVEAVLMLGH
ncbi:hypothetical protein [Pseudophaeobacter sp.]|uniref:hypothetical protein n=1 Tax=Pseudophaeobacter sp. TaxID=1971739 RepID=UPI0032999806